MKTHHGTDGCSRSLSLMGKLTLHLAKPTPESLAALYKRLTGRDISVEEVRAALAKKGTVSKG